MTDYSLNVRWQENRSAWTEYWEKFTLDKFAIALIVLALAIVGFGYFNQHGSAINWTNIFGDFYANVSSELVSIVITVLVLERLNARRQDKQELTRLKALLGSNESVVTKIAVAELKARGWLYDGSLKGTDLRGANLREADLEKADLEEADLFGSNLEGSNLYQANLENATLRGNLQNADLRQANLKSATLIEANLKSAHLNKANLQQANLTTAKLKSAILMEANLSGATLHLANFEEVDLRGANLQNADLIGANFDNVKLSFDSRLSTIIPNGTEWSEDTDIKRFTNPRHPEFKATLAELRENQE